MALLKRLTGERGRWEQGSETFKNQMSTIIGDVLLMSAFMAYAGMAGCIFYGPMELSQSCSAKLSGIRLIGRN